MCPRIKLEFFKEEREVMSLNNSFLGIQMDYSAAPH